MVDGPGSDGVQNGASRRLESPVPFSSTPSDNFHSIDSAAGAGLRHFDFTLRTSYNRQRPEARFCGQFALGFDVDGVFLNDVNYHELTAQVLCHRYKVDIDLHQVRQAREEGLDLWSFAKEKVWTRASVSETELERQLRDIESYAHGSLRDRVLICPEARDYLQSIPVKIFAATNRHHDSCLAGIMEIGVDRLLSNMFCKSDGHRIKPNADMLVSARDKLAIDSEAIIFIDDSTVNQRPLALNAERAGIRVINIGVLPPGYGWSHRLEDSLFDAGAVAVFPSVNHLIKDLAKNMFGDVEAYERIKAGMKRHHADLDLRRFDPRFRTEFGEGAVFPVSGFDNGQTE